MFVLGNHLKYTREKFLYNKIALFWLKIRVKNKKGAKSL